MSRLLSRTNNVKLCEQNHSDNRRRKTNQVLSIPIQDWTMKIRPTRRARLRGHSQAAGEQPRVADERCTNVRRQPHGQARSKVNVSPASSPSRHRLWKFRRREALDVWFWAFRHVCRQQRYTRGFGGLVLQMTALLLSSVGQRNSTKSRRV